MDGSFVRWVVVSTGRQTGGKTVCCYKLVSVTVYIYVIASMSISS